MEVFEEIKGVFTSETMVGEVLPIGLGAVVADRFGDRIAGILPEGIKKPLGAYVDAVSEGLIGLGVVGVSTIAPKDWKQHVRLMGVAAIGLGAFHAISHLIGGSSSHSSPPNNPVKPMLRGAQPYQGKVMEFR